MLKHTLIIGLNDKDTLTQVIPTEQVKAIISNTVGDCTIKQGATGYYTMNNGAKVIEESLTVEIFGSKTRVVTQQALQLKQLLNQESIILDTQKVNSRFI